MCCICRGDDIISPQNLIKEFVFIKNLIPVFKNKSAPSSPTLKQEAQGPHHSPKQLCLIIKKLELIHEICNIDL